jgi:hypothetical protein
MIANAPNLRDILSSVRSSATSQKFDRSDIDRFSAMTLNDFLYTELPSGGLGAKAVYYELMLKFTAKHSVKRSVLEGLIASGDISMLKDSEITYMEVLQQATRNIEWKLDSERRQVIADTAKDEFPPPVPLSDADFANIKLDLALVEKTIEKLQKQFENAGFELFDVNCEYISRGDRPSGWMLDGSLMGVYIHANGTTSHHLIAVEDVEAWVKNPLALLARIHEASPSLTDQWLSGVMPFCLCGKKGCSNRKTLASLQDGRYPVFGGTQYGFSSPQDYERSLTRSHQINWYCTTHRTYGWEMDGLLSFELANAVSSLQTNPGLTATDLNLTKSDVQLLVDFGLIKKEIKRGGPNPSFGLYLVKTN